MSDQFYNLNMKMQILVGRVVKDGKKYFQSVLSQGEKISRKGKSQIEIEKLKWELKQKCNELGHYVAEKKISKLNKDNLENILKELIGKHKTNFKGVGQPLRIALTGSKFGPGIYDIILSLDKNEVVERLKIIE